jgi:restriction system protein
VAEAEPTIWGIHGGRHGEADALFLKKNCIAIGWSKLPDLSAIPPYQEAIKAKIAETYPDTERIGV